MRLSFCAGVAIFQAALALGALALGYPQVALAFGAFALLQIVTLGVQQCAVRPVLDRR